MGTQEPEDVRQQADAEQEAFALWANAEEEAALAVAQAREQASLAVAQARQQADLAVAQAEAQAALALDHARAAAARRVSAVKGQAARRLAEVERLEQALVAEAEERAARAVAEAEARAAAALGEAAPAIRERAPAPTVPGPAIEPLPAADEVSAGAGEPEAAPRTRRRAARVPDALLPASLLLWLAGVFAVEPAGIDDWGLLPVLPVVFFLALGLLVASIAWTLSEPRLSTVRLGLHLVALVLVLHGTMPLIFPAPVYPWVYKHVGVVGYIDLHGGLDPSVDIYNNWPGFFALAAWFTRIAGVGSPITYAEWAPAYFNLLTCLVLGFVLRSLPVDRRVRWLALFLFVAGNWVGQDYFAPQALAFVLSLAAIGIVLGWFHVNRPPAPVRAARRLVRRLVPSQGAGQHGGPAPDGQHGGPAPDGSHGGPAPDGSHGGPAPDGGPRRGVALAALYAIFGVVVFTHQLSPYLVLFGLAILTMAGMIRPRWVVLGLGAMTVAYLLPRIPFLQSRHRILDSLGPDDLISALRHPFENIHSKGGGAGGGRPMLGRRVTALAAPALILGLWALGAVGAFRRLRAGRPVLVLAILAASPAVLAAGQNYGGEALFRIYLFSLPWTAVLAASALAPREDRWRVATGVRVASVLAVVLGLFMSALYGSAALIQVRPGEVQASQFFADNALPRSVLVFVTANFPERVSGRYDLFVPRAGEPARLTSAPEFRHRMLGADDVPAVSRYFQPYVDANPGGVYLVLSTGQAVWSEVLGLMPEGAVDSLDRALAQAPNWQLFLRNRDAAIYRLLPATGPPVME